MRALLLSWLSPVRLDAVVDRIEPPMAVLEWSSGQLTDMPLALLPADVAEGCRLEVRLHRTRTGLPLAAPPPALPVLETADGPIPLPLPFPSALPSFSSVSAERGAPQGGGAPRYSLSIQRVD